MNNYSDSNPIVWQPSEAAIANSNLAKFMTFAGITETGVAGYDALNKASEADPEWFWQHIIDYFDLQFDAPYTQLLDTSEGIPWAKWCVGGTGNIVTNCLDKYRDTATWTKPALCWEGEDGRNVEWSYEELDQQVCQLAGGIKSLGLGNGDVIALYMPMIPQASVALLAAAKIGAIIQPLFSGFGAESIVTRLDDSGAKAVITVDGTLRRGKTVNLKTVIDEAAESLPQLKHVIVAEHLGLNPAMETGRDFGWTALCGNQPKYYPTTIVPADSPCMLIHTSGTTGKPKGTIYTHCGFSMKLACDFGLMADYQPSDRLMWMSDFGWLVGPVLVFSSLIVGGTMVMAEGAIDYPDNGRFWRLIEENQVSILGVAPTIIRSFIYAGGAGVENYDLSSLRLAVSTGEPWTMDAWMWMFREVLGSNKPINNMSGGTEIGGTILSGTIIHPLKPCSFSGSTLGVGARAVNDNGDPIKPGGEGELVLSQPSPGLTRGLWKDNDRYFKSYWGKFPGLWWQSDRVAIDEDGYWYILGRSDDVLKIAGKRTSPTEIETLALSTEQLSEVAAIGVPDKVKGETVLLVAKLAQGKTASDSIKHAISDAVVKGLGTPFKPKDILFVSDLPKTRSMKVMRRLVRATCLNQPTGDLSALVNPEAITAIQQAAKEVWPDGLNI